MDEATRAAAEELVAYILDSLDEEVAAEHPILIRTVVQDAVQQGWRPATATGTPRLLGPADEPQQAGAVVAVHYGDYRRQEVWVSSGSNVGNWYPLGNEFWAVWDRQRMPAGVTKQHPVSQPGQGPGVAAAHPRRVAYRNLSNSQPVRKHHACHPTHPD